MLRSLTRMQTEMSSETRRMLLNAVTDLFLLDEQPSEAAKSDYGEIANQALSTLGASDRKDYADHVAAAPTLPHSVAMKLAGDDEADVARLVLKLSPVLTDTDLAAIAVTQSQRHLAAIAERALAMVSTGTVAASDGTIIPIEMESVCVHGDSPGAVGIATAVRDRLLAGGIDLAAFV